MARFSERNGFTEPKALKIDGLDAELRTSLWNVCYRRALFSNRTFLYDDEALNALAKKLYELFFKLPLTALPSIAAEFVESQERFFEKAQWYLVLDYIEFLCPCFSRRAYSSYKSSDFCKEINSVFERERSGFRLIDGYIAKITDEIEKNEIEAACVHTGRFKPVSQHMKAALALYAKKPEPELRNAIKEAISGVEAATKIIAGDPKATLGQAIIEIDRKHKLNEAFKHGVVKLYSYTNAEGGIRHAMLEAPNVDDTDARFMLVSCSAFANYLISRCGN